MNQYCAYAPLSCGFCAHWTTVRRTCQSWFQLQCNHYEPRTPEFSSSPAFFIFMPEAAFSFFFSRIVLPSVCLPLTWAAHSRQLVTRLACVTWLLMLLLLAFFSVFCGYITTEAARELENIVVLGYGLIKKPILAAEIERKWLPGPGIVALGKW